MNKILLLNRIARRSTIALAVGCAFGHAAVYAEQQESASAEDDASKSPFEVIEVTANKRAGNLRDMAGAVSALTGEELEKMGADSLSSYINRLPGVHFNDYQPGVSEVVIRGVSSTTYHEQGQTTVGYFINDIPMSEAGWPIVIPDVDTFDLKRVEVLRGPQGTLYGASNLGGLVNYIANEADPSGYEAAAELSAGSTKNSEDANYSVKGMLNVPIIADKLALRVVALDRFEAGYLDNVGTGEDGSNDLEVKGVRGSLVYTPNADTKIAFMSMYQKTELADQTYAIVPTYERDTYIAEPQDTEFTMHTLRFEQRFSFADLTVLGAIAKKENLTVFDYTSYGLLDSTADTAYNGIGKADSDHIEVRLASNGDGPLQWIIGAAHYTSDKTINDAITQEGAQEYIDANPDLFGGYSGSLLAPNDLFNQYIVDQDNKDSAIFGELSYDFSKAFNLTLGGRFFDTSSTSIVTVPPYANYPDVYSAETTTFGGESSETGFTPKISAKYHFNDDVMLYATYTEGFRVGGTNPNSAITEEAEENYKSDTTKNYEIGTRLDLLDRTLQLDTTVFQIDWDDMQVRLYTDAGLAYVTNAGKAKITGVEFTAGWRPTSWFEYNTSITYQDGHITEFLPATYAANGNGGYPAGTDLPGSAPWAVNNNLTVTLENVKYVPRISVAQRYTAKSDVAFESTTKRGGYNIWDLKADFDLTDQIALSFQVKNLFDKYGIVNAPFGDDYTDGVRGTVTRPRSIGATLSWKMF